MKKQFKFIQENKEFIRGGIAVGHRFKKHDKQDERSKQYISNGFARAVKLESSFVDWPIIGADKKTITDINSIILGPIEDDGFSLVQGFNKEGSLLYFIDFIENKDNYLDLIGEKIEKYSDPDKEDINNTQSRNESIRNKYIWLLRYYAHKYEGVVIPKSLKGIVL